jgi:hypothetical protein
LDMRSFILAKSEKFIGRYRWLVVRKAKATAGILHCVQNDSSKREGT